ncbi:hypothetical protein BGZ46_008750 [Entomortierella lignicola]|nr:hypothetical protein BGZ46_008750 [Entomortierella lignicola]
MFSQFSLRSLRTTLQHSRRLHTTPKVAPYNIAFDIDGVLIKVRVKARGKQAISQTRRALELLEE